MTSKRKNSSQCDVTSKKLDLTKYEKLDGVWKDLGLAAPARRALVNNKIIKISDFAKFSEEQVANFHGMGPNAMATLKNAKVKFKK